MDMKKILESLDSAEKGETKANPAEAGSMKKILESFNAVEEGCGDYSAPSMPEPEKVTMNVSLNAQGVDAIEDLLGLMGKSKEPVRPMQGGAAFDLDTDGMDDMQLKMAGPKDSHDDMKKLMAITSDPIMDDDIDTEDYDNAPDEEYRDDDYMTRDISGGLNRQKKQYPASVRGDNAMSVESIKDRLYAALNEKKGSDQDDDGDKDFADVQIARMVKSGMSKKQAIAKTKNKKYNK